MVDFKTRQTELEDFVLLVTDKLILKKIFSKLAHYNFPGWAVLEWECCYKNQEVGAKEGAAFINNHIINVTDKAFDDFAGAKSDVELNKKILGI